MKQKLLSFMLLFCIFSGSLFAQKNSIALYMGGYKMYDVLSYQRTVNSIAGLRINRTLNERMTIELGYYFPNAQGIQVQGMGRRLCEQEKLDSYDDVGKLFYREYYHYFDLGAGYRVFFIKNQSLRFKQSVSVAYGTNMYLANVGAIETIGNPFHVLFTEYNARREMQFGGVTGLAYDYYFGNTRINAGIDIAARYYTKSFPFQLNYGLHLGYNF
jgi:hypothetical protein